MTDRKTVEIGSAKARAIQSVPARCTPVHYLGSPAFPAFGQSHPVPQPDLRPRRDFHRKMPAVRATTPRAAMLCQDSFMLNGKLRVEG